MERSIKYMVSKLEEERVAGGHANCKYFCDKFKKYGRKYCTDIFAIG